MTPQTARAPSPDNPPPGAMRWKPWILEGGRPYLLVAFLVLYSLRRTADSLPTIEAFSIGEFGRSLVTVLVTYGCGVLAVWFANRVFRPEGSRRMLALALAVSLGVVAGHFLALGPVELATAWRIDPVQVAVEPVRFLGIGLLGVAVFLMEERDAAARRALHDESLRRGELERAGTEAQISVLQSQVEPHFLFNTLAHLRRLYATEPAAGHAMMSDLERYLGDARPALRTTSITLEADARLALAYLNLQKVRMGSRLTFSFDLPPPTCAARLPPMSLTTLVENAIEHGLSDLPAGGTIRVRASTEGVAVRVEVSDDGRGLRSTLGPGVGLANLRARLAVLHGDRARLELAQNDPSGVRATIVLPRPVGEATP